MPADLAVVAASGSPDRDTVVATLVAAFADDSAVRMLYPTDLEYADHFPGFMQAFGGRAFDAGAVDVTADGGGVALWFPPGLEPDGDAVIAHMEATMPVDRLAALIPGMEMQGVMHPAEPHWYLPWMAVRPEAQGQGIGTDLLRIGLARADAEGLPIYLEATTRRNAKLYARHGFVATGIVELPGYPEIVAMWRTARI